jgi:hypothetical protein
VAHVLVRLAELKQDRQRVHRGENGGKPEWGRGIEPRNDGRIRKRAAEKRPEDEAHSERRPDQTEVLRPLRRRRNIRYGGLSHRQVSPGDAIEGARKKEKRNVAQHNPERKEYIPE